jgi:hypothetical protein
MGSLDVELGGHFGAHPAARPAEGALDAPTFARHLPNVAAMGPALAGQDDAAEFEYGLELLLAGFAGTVGAP